MKRRLAVASIVALCGSGTGPLLCESLSSTPPRSMTSDAGNVPHVTRQIQACGANVDRSQVLLDEYIKDSADCLAEAPFLAALRVCSKAKRHDLAVSVYHQFPSESCRSLAISICGKSGQYQEALNLLQESSTGTLPSVWSYNAAISACGQAMAWQQSLTILQSMPLSIISTCTCNAVLTALGRSKRGFEAVQLLHLMKTSSNGYPPPDRSSYHNTVLALIREGKLQQARDTMEEMKQTPETYPGYQTYDILTAAYGKRKQWDLVHELEQQQEQQQHQTAQAMSESRPTQDDYFLHWEVESMTKVGRGNGAYWEMGTFTMGSDLAFTVALQPHRNPAKNGISIILIRGGEKVGYLLMINSAVSNTSTLLGVYVDPTQRKNGLSKIFIATWLHLSLMAKLSPVTGVINKPLLALVMQHSFGYVPTENKGVDAEVSCGENGAIVLYSSSLRSLQGAFSPRDIKREGIQFPDSRPEPSGRVVRIGTRFYPPKEEHQLLKTVQTTLSGKRGDGVLQYTATPDELRKVFIGT